MSRKTVFFGGSSSVFSSAFAALLFRSSAQSIIATRLPPSLTEREKKVFSCLTSSTRILALNVFLFSSKLFLIIASLGSDPAKILAIIVFLRFYPLSKEYSHKQLFITHTKIQLAKFIVS